MEEHLYPLTIGAVQAGNLDTSKVAAAYGTDLDMRFPNPLCDQALGIWDKVYDIDRGPEITEDDEKHDWAWAAPLHVAVMQGRYEIVEWLIEQGVDLENPGRHLWSVDLEMELAIAFLHAWSVGSLSDADLHFLLETSGLSLDMELEAANGC
ncbi:ankyrin repeat domain protein [Colletotrichum tofieldiae]|uniref:Ankyrin repeat domain protein n=1 Tax=Colletotrichum tofieldiae TaxID=708197 RepID=A0A166NMF1_9PEZI|nr:ankyrin repeat domain protein [Colletotrichum tofieldiae]